MSMRSCIQVMRRWLHFMTSSAIKNTILRWPVGDPSSWMAQERAGLRILRPSALVPRAMGIS